jgi:hypothetical protein
MNVRKELKDGPNGDCKAPSQVSAITGRWESWTGNALQSYATKFFLTFLQDIDSLGSCEPPRGRHLTY